VRGHGAVPNKEITGWFVEWLGDPNHARAQHAKPLHGIYVMIRREIGLSEPREGAYISRNAPHKEITGWFVEWLGDPNHARARKDRAMRPYTEITWWIVEKMCDPNCERARATRPYTERVSAF